MPVGSDSVLALVCLDVDGTLVGSSGEPSDRLWGAAATARARGQHLTLCTARLAAGATKHWAQQLDPDGWHIFHAGAVIWRPSTGAVESSDIGAAAVAEAIATGNSNGWVVEVYSWDDYAVDSDAPLAVAHSALLELPHRRRALDSIAGPVVRVQWVINQADTELALSLAPPGCHASAATSPSMPGAAFISLTLASVSKASGIAAVAGKIGVGMGDVMMVGDGQNDVPALEAVGWPVAIGDGAPQAKAAAKVIVAAVDDEGAAEAIDLSGTLSAVTDEVPATDV